MKTISIRPFHPLPERVTFGNMGLLGAPCPWQARYSRGEIMSKKARKRKLCPHCNQDTTITPEMELDHMVLDIESGLERIHDTANDIAEIMLKLDGRIEEAKQGC